MMRNINDKKNVYNYTDVCFLNKKHMKKIFIAFFTMAIFWGFGPMTASADYFQVGQIFRPSAPYGYYSITGQALEPPRGNGPVTGQALEPPHGKRHRTGQALEPPHGKKPRTGQALRPPHGEGPKTGQALEMPRGEGPRTGQALEPWHSCFRKFH
jgi:hypothetical protein